MRVYLDSAATTRPLPEAISAFREACLAWGNPSSPHDGGRCAQALLSAARRSVAGALSVPERTLVFTSGGTEANNLAIFGTAARTRRRHIVSTALEHPSVAQPLKELCARGFSLTTVPPRGDGRIHAADIAAAMREDTFLVSCILVCNETGAVCEAGEVGAAVRAANTETLLHMDAVQGFLHIPFDPQRAGVDLASVSAHKVGGVKGAGALYVRPGLRLSPLIYGGGQESGLRSGTEAVSAICAFGAAAARFAPPPPELRDYAVRALERIGAVIVPSPDAPHIVSFALRGVPGEVAVRMLDDAGISLSTGAACARGKKSRVALALGLPDGLAGSMLRASFSGDTSESDIDALCDALRAVASRFSAP